MKIDGNNPAKPLISICVPVLNEEESMPFLVQRLNEVTGKLGESFDFEYIFTDNNSTDKTWEILQDLRQKNSGIRAYRFGKNVGFQKSILFNYKQAKGNAVIQIDADL